MKKITLIISAFVLSSAMVVGQNTRTVSFQSTENAIYKQKSQEIIDNAPRTPDGHVRCLTAEAEKLKSELNPNYQTKAQFEAWIYQKIKELKSNPNYGAKASRNIPVVVHVLYNNTTQNISLAQVQNQIATLNEDFSATNPDFGNIPTAFANAAGNMDIQFCLAGQDPSGAPTDGVDRISVPVSSVSDVDIETNYGLNNMWDPTKYLNIFVGNISGGLLGKAVFPTGSGLSGLPGGSAPTYDGVMINYTAFGSIGTAQAPYDKGRSASHEIGHWLGLRHIWGDANCGNDFCNDTPTQQASNFNCPTYPQTNCSSSNMFMNYMDYVPDACMIMFSNDQKLRMDAVLLNSVQRKELLTSTKCGVGALTANFTESATVINAGQTITFTDASNGPNPITTWAWNFDVGGLGGVTPTTASTQGPHTVTFNTAGTYSVSLTAGDGSTTNTKNKTSYITVNPSGTVTCDSTAANWDWNTEAFGAAYWGQDNAACAQALAGLIVGNNCYDDNGWASKVTFSATGKELTDVLYMFVRSVGTGAATLKVWDNTGAAGAPGAVMTSMATTTGAYSANLNQFISMPVSPAVALNGNFYIGYDHNVTPITGDSLAMGVSNGTTGNQAWAKETTGWKDLTAYGVNYKGTVVAVICNISTGEKELLGDLKEITVFPNPSTGSINIALPSKTSTSIEVYSVVGKLVYEKTENSQLITVNIKKLPNGVYFVKVKSGKQLLTRKIVLSK